MVSRARLRFMVGESLIKTPDEKLALEGGEPVLPEGPPCWPALDPQIASVLTAMSADGSWGRYEGVHGERLVEILSELHKR